MSPTLRSFVLAAALFLAALGTGYAQFSIGLHGGAAISNANLGDDGGALLDEDGDTEFTTSFTFGVPVELRITDAFAIQPEVNFMRQGLQQKSEFLGQDFTAKLQFNTLEVPVLAKFGRLEAGGVSFAALVGPAAQYYVSARSVAIVDGTKSTDKIELKDEDEVRRLNLLGVVGAQLGIPLPFGKIVFDGRYRHQFTNSVKDTDGTYRARIFSATAGIMFNLGGN